MKASHGLIPYQGQIGEAVAVKTVIEELCQLNYCKNPFEYKDVRTKEFRRHDCVGLELCKR